MKTYVDRRHSNFMRTLRSGIEPIASLFALVVLGFSLHALATPTAASSGAEWKESGGTPEGTRYTNLTSINPSNVHLLVDTKILTGVQGGHQGQPLVVNLSKNSTPNMMMLALTPYPNLLKAYDMTGALKWTYAPKPSEYSQGVACCDVVNRGLAYYNNVVVIVALDGTVAAVNATTGKQLWRRTGLASPPAGETVTAAPLIVPAKVGANTKNMVVIGNAGAEMGIRGWVQALDLANGKTIWKKFNTGSDADVGIVGSTNIPNFTSTQTAEEASITTSPSPNLGCTTWGDAANCTGSNKWKQGGATVWAWFTLDSETNVIYYGTANPGVWNPSMRPGSNKWSSAIFARDPLTGNVKWVNQLTPHDGWDYDSMNESIVIKDGNVKQVVHFDKNGFAYKLNAVTGALIDAKPFVNVTWVKRDGLGNIIYDPNGMPQADPLMMPEEGRTSGIVCPAPLGGKEFAPAAYSPNTGHFYVPAINFCSTHMPAKINFISGTPFVGDTLGFLPDFNTLASPQAPVISGAFRSLGELIAWDAQGNKAWSIPEANPLWGGVLVTASNLVFYGTLDNHFKAIDVNHPTNGDGSPNYLLDVTLECGVIGNPISYLDNAGKQKIAVFTGISWLPGLFVTPGTPQPCSRQMGEGDDDNQGGNNAGALQSGAIHIFSLP